MVDNFKQISELLEFPSEDAFYFAQVIQRKKDSDKAKGTNNSNRLIKAYYITSVDHLINLKDEIVHFVEYFNARAGINLNARSFERTAFHTMKKISDQLMNKNFKSVRRAYNTVCGKYSNGDKRWILDIDDVEDTSPMMEAYIEYECDPKMVVDFDKVGIPISTTNSKIIARIPTKSGFHLITRPFNISQFKQKYPSIEIHKNNPTALYYP